MLLALIFTVLAVSAEDPKNKLFPNVKPLNYKTYDSLSCAKLEEKCRAGGDCSLMETICHKEAPAEQLPIEANEHETLQLLFVIATLGLLTGGACYSCGVKRRQL
jgi:hypothetical protein